MSKPLRIALYVGDEARLDRIEAIRIKLGALNASAAVNLAVDIVAVLLGVSGPLDALAAVRDLLTAKRPG